MHNSHEKLMNTRTCRTMMRINVFLRIFHLFRSAHSMAFRFIVDQMLFFFLLLCALLFAHNHYHRIPYFSYMFHSMPALSFIFVLLPYSRHLLCHYYYWCIAFCCCRRCRRHWRRCAVVACCIRRIWSRTKEPFVWLPLTHSPCSKDFSLSVQSTTTGITWKDSVIRCRHFLYCYSKKRSAFMQFFTLIRVERARGA